MIETRIERKMVITSDSDDIDHDAVSSPLQLFNFPFSHWNSGDNDAAIPGTFQRERIVSRRWRKRSRQ